MPKDEDEDDEQYGKRPRLSLIPPRTSSQDGRRNKGIIASAFKVQNICGMIREKKKLLM